VKNSKLLSNFKQVGFLVEDGANLKWVQNKDNRGDVDHYPVREGEKTEGAMVIYEHPIAERPAPFLYVAGLDPYDIDQAESSTSLGSLLIWKRTYPGAEFSNTLVAEYTARPETSDLFYYNCMLLLKYYNASCLAENMNRGVFTYFYNHGCEYLLADQPDIITEILSTSRVQRRKGIHMTKEIKNTGILWAKELLYTPSEDEERKM